MLFVDLDITKISDSGKDINGFTNENISAIKKVSGVDDKNVYSLDSFNSIIKYRNDDSIFNTGGLGTNLKY
ncbi:MAG: hypothetical protein WCJ62_13390 [Flavobacterium sp.]